MKKDFVFNLRGFTMDSTEYKKKFSYPIWSYEGAIYHNEAGYLGGESKEMTWVAVINHDKKEIRPTHGYFMPNPTGNKLAKYAESIGYTFNNR